MFSGTDFARFVFRFSWDFFRKLVRKFFGGSGGAGGGGGGSGVVAISF